MPDYLRIPSNVRQDALEDISAELERVPAASLEVPEKLAEGGALGLEARLVHVIVQWARGSQEATLALPSNASRIDSYLQSLCGHAYGFVALALANRVVTANGVEIPSRDIRGLVGKRIADFENPNLRIFAAEEGHSLLSIYGHPHEYESWLFSPSSTSARPRLRPASDLESWFERAVSELVPAEFLERFEAGRRRQLAAATYELLENTFLHGRRNEYAEPLRAGISGVTMRLVRVPFAGITAIAGGSQDVRLYFINRLARDVSGENRFFEVTVFDSGIGYHRWINAPCNDNPEVQQFRGKSEADTVRDCLQKHATSKTTEGSGVGLFRVTRLLKALFGFVRIRTGRSCFYARLDQTLSGAPRVLGGQYDEIMNPEIDLRPWFADRELPEAHGTSVTLCVPLTQWRKA